MKNVGPSMKVFVPAKVKCAVVFALISFAFVSPAVAVLRPLFPAKPVPPLTVKSCECGFAGNSLACHAVRFSEVTAAFCGLRGPCFELTETL